MKNIKLNLCMIPVQRQVQKFVKEISKTTKTKIGTDFAYFHEKDLIEYSFLMTEKSGDTFYNFVVNRAWDRYKNIKIERFDIFIICMLHELGHVYTFDYDEHDTYFTQRENLDNLSISAKSDDERKEIFEKYHNLPDELLATDFAIDFVENNYQYCCEWDKIFRKTFQKFFKRMGVKD